MKKDIFNDDQTFIEWAQHIEPAKRIPKHIHHKIYKDMHKRLHPESSDSKKTYMTKHVKAAVAASLVLLIGSISVAVDAGTQGAVFGVFKKSEDIQHLNDQPALINSDTSTNIQNDVSNIHSRIIDASAFGPDNFFNTVNDVTAKENSSSFEISEIAFGPMDMLIIAKDDYSGWELSEGEQLKMDISIDPFYAHADGTGENMVCGYVYNGKYHESEFQKATEFTFTITADKSGTYYPVLQNVGVSYIHILSGIVYLSS